MTINFRNFVVAIQGNFDHLMGTLRQLGSAHNLLVRDVDDIVEMLGDVGQDVDAQMDSAEHTAIGDSAPHHAAVTVGTGLDVAGQLVTLDLSEVSAGGELGGTMDAPTVDATHSGSAHHSAVTEGAGIDVSGQVVSVDLSEIAAGGELGGTMDAPTVDATHSGTSHAGLLSTAAADADAEVDAHEGLSDPHTGYVLESLMDAAGDLIIGSADNTVARLARGSDDQVLTATATTIEWATPAASGGGGSKMFAAWLGA